ncbi:hypothetical protein BACPU_25910 [Bacillus pumilus]|nr:hypothetical protein BACPU_25910 [Bacillus pumilus]
MTVAMINSENFSMDFFNTPYIKGVIQKELRSKVNQQDQEDVMQDIVYGLLKYLQNHEVPQDKMKFVIITVIRRGVIAYYRRKNTIKHKMLYSAMTSENDYEKYNRSLEHLHEDDPMVFTDFCVDYYEKYRNHLSENEQQLMDTIISDGGVITNMADICRDLNIHKCTGTRAINKLRSLCR